MTGCGAWAHGRLAWALPVHAKQSWCVCSVCVSQDSAAAESFSSLELLRVSQDSGIAGFFCMQEYSHDRSECREVVCGDFFRDTSNDGCCSLFSARECQFCAPHFLPSRLHSIVFGAIYLRTRRVRACWGAHATNQAQMRCKPSPNHLHTHTGRG